MEKSWLERFLDRHFSFKEIRDGCDTVGIKSNNPIYLKRWFIVGNDENWDGFHLLLHHILRSDADRELHDHPFDFVSVILWRGYLEETELHTADFPAKLRHLCTPACHPLRRKWPGMILDRRSAHRHRVHLIDEKPSWSLVFTSGKKRDWGFWRDGNFIPHKNFISRRCQEEQDRITGAANNQAQTTRLDVLSPTLPRELPDDWS